MVGVRRLKWEAVGATATRSDGSTQDVTTLAAWSSSMPSVATVSGGLVTAVSEGQTTISASYQEHVGTLTVEVASPNACREILPPCHLSFTVQPTNVEAGAPIVPAVEVAAASSAMRRGP
jgi:uncharacterized protein YjdB